MKGADVVVRVLEHLGVKCVFGIPGGASLPLFDAMYRSSIHVVLTRHEQGASHMADGFSRSTNQVGVCMATSGPGATNLVTGLATAYMDSIPMIAITGQVQTKMIGSDAFQEADAIGCTRSVTKHNYLIMDPKDIVSIVMEAFCIATSGKPGPVHIDIPVDVQKADIDFSEKDLEQHISIRSYSKLEIQHQSISDFFSLLKYSKKPLLYVGGGAVSSGVSKQLVDFSHRYNIPIVTTLMANGVVDFKDDLYAGVIGMHGKYSANIAMQRCDLLIACGARFDDRVTGVLSRFSPHSKKIHLDIDATNVDKIIQVDLHIIGDLSAIFSKLLKYNSLTDVYDMQPWIEEIREWDKQHPLSYPSKSKDGFVRPQYVIERLHHITGGDCILTTGVGQHQMWAMQWYPCRFPKHFLTSGGLGTMGYGLPSAIGASIANKNKQVVCIDGDGSFQMTMCELGTMVQEKTKVIVIIFNNFYLGMVRQWQELFYQKRFASSTLGKVSDGIKEHQYYPDFVKIAEAYGIQGKRIVSESGIDKILSDALDSTESIIFDVIVNPSDKVFPMVPSGHALDEMVIGE